jgi:Glycerophosphoryl diester phosphodiesterase family
MKFLLLCILISSGYFHSFAQPLIHAHNDYQKPEPLTNALRYKAFSIEADIYLSGNRLLVAHDINELTTAKTLDSLYLQPIIELFRLHKGTISDDSSYAPVLLIDIKDKGEAVLAALIKFLSPYPSVFDRRVNAKAMQVVISGDRGLSSTWISYPSYILFDGRPNESYDNATLKRVAFISDSWVGYNLPPADDDHERLKLVIGKVHNWGKMIRLWASPDNPASWKLQLELGVDIINTDKVEECRNYFYKSNKEKN